MAIQGQPTDRQTIHHELERVRADLHRLVAHASAAELRRGTDGTRWTNQQMLWHMAFGYLIVLRLLPLVRLFGLLPEPFSRTFAAALNAGTPPVPRHQLPRLLRWRPGVPRPPADQGA